MTTVLSKVKGTEFTVLSEHPGLPGSFQEAFERGVIDVSPDAQDILWRMDEDPQNRAPKIITERFLVVSVRCQKDINYILSYGLRLLNRGWKVFLDYQSFLSIACGPFREVLPRDCDEISLALQFQGKLRAMTMVTQGSAVSIDTHPSEFANRLLQGYPLGVGENVLLLR